MQDLVYTDFIRVASAIPVVEVADCKANSDAIVALVQQAASKKARIVVFPELTVTGYTCGDLFLNAHLVKSSNAALQSIADRTAELDIAIVVGIPLRVDGILYNCAAVLYRGDLVMIAPKTYLPDYGEFYEKRWWTSAGGCADRKVDVPETRFKDIPFSCHQLFQIDGVKAGIEICEDLWAPIAPSIRMALAGAEVILNLSASDEVIGKYDYLRRLVAMQSARGNMAYVYAGAGFGESSTDVVFDGKAFIAENGSIIAANKRWVQDHQLVVADVDLEALRHERIHRKTFADCAAFEVAAPYTIYRLNDKTNAEVHGELLDDVFPLPFVPEEGDDLENRCSDITNIQVTALSKRLLATNCKSLVVGISGGLDSTLALLVAVETFKKLGLNPKGIVGVTMPGFGTTGRTHYNAVTLMKTLGITIREVPIAAAVNQHFADIGHDPSVHDATYENAQARQRTYILMDIANQVGGMVLGTGDMSELALGWATYNGDHMSMYGINSSIPKTLVKTLVSWFASKMENKECAAALMNIVDTPISPELIPANEDGTIKQKTEDLVGPYELHDFFLYHFIRYGRAPRKIFALASHAFAGRYDDKTILHWLRTFFRRFFNQQFKRSCMPDGPKVGRVNLSPRGDWRMPSDASSASYLREIDELINDNK